MEGKAQRQSEVRTGMAELERCISDMFAQIDAIEDRLSCVLRLDEDEVPAEAKAKKQIEPVPLANELSALATRVRMTTVRISLILDRLEL